MDAACQGCQAFESFVDCKRAAGEGACLPYWQAAACHSKPVYNVCRSYSTFDEYFFAMARIFCISGPDGGSTMDGGTAPDASTTDDGSQSDDGGETGSSEAGSTEAGSMDP